MRLWITRARPGAEATARRLRDLGHDPVVEPLLFWRTLKDAVLSPDVAAAAFTSANGVLAFAQLSDRRNLPVFAVGEATARAAREEGFLEVRSADGDVAALARLIAAAAPRGPVLHAAAKEPAGDLVGALRAADVPAVFAAVYETAELSPAPPADIDGLLIQSPRAGRAAARLLEGVDTRRLSLFAQSAACAAPLAELAFQRVAVAPQPSEASLLAAIDG